MKLLGLKENFLFDNESRIVRTGSSICIGVIRSIVVFHPTFLELKNQQIKNVVNKLNTKSTILSSSHISHV